MAHQSAITEPGSDEAPGKPEPKRQNPLDRLAALSAPTADIEQMIAEIENG